MTSIADQLNPLRSDYTLVGVTGHRDLITDPAVQTLIRKRVWEKLTELKSTHARLLLLCPMAPGADQLVKEVADALGIPVVVLLPMGLADYDVVSFSEPEYADTFRAVKEFVAMQPERVIYLADTPEQSDIESKSTEIEPVTQLASLAKVLATYCDHLLALWDGVDRGLSDGGTSHVVHMALSGLGPDGQPLHRTRPGLLHHLITPRRSNPFPLSARHRAVHLPFPALPSLGELTWDVPVPFPPQKKQPGWVMRQWEMLRQWGTMLTNFWVPIGLVGVVMLFGYQGFLKWKHYKEAYKVKTSVWERELKALPDSVRQKRIAAETATFRQTYRYPFWILEWDSDSFFKAANLSTLGTSVLEADDDEKVPVMLHIGRAFGLMFLVYAFGLAFILAMDNERLHRLWFGCIRTIYPRRFSLVIGLNDRSFNLITDLRRLGVQVVVLTADANSPYRESCVNRGVIFLKGLPYETESLRKCHFQRAERVYVMTDSEENNIRTVQEMDQLWDNTSSVQAGVWYVQVENAMLADLMLQSFRSKPKLELHIVNLYETIARRQLLNFPIDRFYPKTSGLPETDVAQVAIFGFGPMGQALTLACLRLGHFAGGRRLKVRVYVANAAEVRQQFEQQYPCLSTQHENPYDGGLTRTVRDTTFPTDVLTFEELPQSAAQLLNPDFSLFGMVNATTALSVYGCLDNAMQSAALLRTVLPRLQYLRQVAPGNLADVQVFGFYNLPDEDEVNHLMRQMNALVPGLPVSFFGNFLRECTAEAIHNQALNELGQAINGCYDTSKDPRESWLATSEENRESSRQAGDHMWVKLRYVHHRLNTHPADWQTVRQTIQPQLADYDASKVDTHKLVQQLSELEHTRWNAEKLLLGYVAFQDIDPAYKLKPTPDKLMARWKPQKTFYKTQRLQIDLIPYDQLALFYPAEALKDKAQVIYMPTYLKALLDLDDRNRKNGTPT